MSTTNGILFRRHTSRRYKHGKTARVLGIATLALTLTWTPYWIFILKSTKHLGYNLHLSPKLTSSPVIYFFLIKLSKNSYYLNYLLNPIFYSFLNQRFRQHVNGLFETIFKFLFKFCCFCCYKIKVNKLNERNEFENRKINLNNNANDLNCSSQPILQNRRVIDSNVKYKDAKNSTQSIKLFKTRIISFISRLFANCCSKINSTRNSNFKPEQQQQQTKRSIVLEEQLFYTNSTNVFKSNTKIGTVYKVNSFENQVHAVNCVNSRSNLNDEQ